MCWPERCGKHRCIVRLNATNPSEKDFAELLSACAGGPVPFVVRLPNDQHTPVSVFSNLRRKNSQAFFLESVETGLRQGRYSFMGAAPKLVFSFSEGKFNVLDGKGKKLESVSCEDPLRELERHMDAYKSSWPEELVLPPLVGGMVGYLGYDSVHYFEPIGDMLPDEIGMPEMSWMLVDQVACFDHLHSEILISKCLLPEEMEGKSPAALYSMSMGKVREFAQSYLCPADLSEPSFESVFQKADSMPEGLSSNCDEKCYCDIVERAKKHIREGDIFQVVPSRRYSMPLGSSPLSVYRTLRKLNPSSYMFALKLGDHEAIGSSPETQLRCERGRLMMRPLAGTRRRTNDRVEDERLAKELLADEKECAEHRMLVDLVRNDLGRVAKSGSVTITRLLEVEFYSHVMHITSEVEAELADDKSVFDAMRATFPAGTLSGAPKVRAMQLINGFEKVRRNLYGGLVGYIDFAGNSDSCIAIRMMMASGGKAYVQAGGGLVADSKPGDEYQETVNKAAAVLSAIAEANAMG